MGSHPFRPLVSLALLLALLLCQGVPAGAQLSEQARISLITILPGDAVYAVFGHSAIRVRDPAADLDLLYNYGTFDFGFAPVFVCRFLYGALDYSLDVGSYPLAVVTCGHLEERSILEQDLSLSARQRDDLYRFLEWNARPENRYYRYDFFFDNCATRIRDAFEKVLGEEVRFAPGPDPGLSFRRLLAPYLAARPFLHAGIDLVLGPAADRVATAREAMFLPAFLREAFDRATNTVAGETVPLVTHTRKVVWNEAGASGDGSLPWPSILLWGVLGVGLALAVRDLRWGAKGGLGFDRVLLGGVGTLGLILLFLWLVSLHTVTGRNLNLLWAWPTHLIAARALVRRPVGPVMRVYLCAMAVAAVCLALCLPLLPQTLPPFVLPLLLLLAVRGLALAGRAG